jgi:hypothetical protein
MFKETAIYSFGAVCETILTQPIDVIRTRFINRTPLWRGYRGIMSGISFQFIGLIPNRVVFLGGRDFSKRANLNWVVYSPIVSLAQTIVETPFINWKTARIEGLPIKYKPYGFFPLYIRNTIFALGLFGARDCFSESNSILSTLLGVSAGVILSQPFDVIRNQKQSIDRDKSIRYILNDLHKISKKEGIFNVYWRGVSWRLGAAYVGITTMIESTKFIKSYM